MGVDRKSVSALLRLSYKQRLIRFPVQFIKVLVADPSCNTDAYGRFQGSPFGRVYISGGFTDLLCFSGDHFIIIFPCIKYTKFIPAKPSDNIFASKIFFQYICDLLNHIISFCMSIGIVNLFKKIQIYHEKSAGTWDRI